MTIELPRWTTRAARGASAFAGAAAIVVGVLDLACAAHGLSLCALLFPGTADLMTTTALGFICLGAAKFAAANPASSKARGLLARVGALAAASIGILTLGRYALAARSAMLTPGLAAPDTALCFVLMSASLWLKAAPRRSEMDSNSAVVLAILVAATGLTVLLVTSIFGSMGWFGFQSMAVPAAALFALLGLTTAASLITRSNRHWALDLRGTAAFVLGLVSAVSVSLYMSGRMDRIARLRVAAQPAISGHAQELERQARDADLIAAGGTLGGIAALVAGLLIVNGALLKKRQGDEALRQSENRFRSLFESSRDALATAEGASLRWSSANAAAVAMFRAKDEADFISRGPAEVSPEFQPDGRRSADAVREIAESVLREGSRHFEWIHKRLDGEEFPADVLLNRGELDGKTFIQATIRDLTEVHRANDERRLLATAIEQTSECVLITDAGARILYVNPAFERVTGFSRAEALGNKPSFLKSGRHDVAFYQEMWAALARGETWRGRLFNRRKNGDIYEEDCSIAPVRGDAGAVTHYIAVKRDVSEQRALEAQFFHSQRMEAVGRLAGGVAHDFNNILTSIIGCAQLMGPAVAGDRQAAEDAATIIEAGMRAAALTRQLLTFSRRQAVENATFDLNRSVAGIERMLKRTLGEDVRLKIETHEHPLWINADAGQIDQVLLNLAVNARDAMPRGGVLTVSTRAAEYTAPRVSAQGTAPPGVYALLRCTDTGMGMDETVLAHLFEPFFTTKEKGKGTGLGLSTVYGIVKQAGGHLFVDSAPGRGAAFDILLPSSAPPAAREESAPIGSPAACTETILVVEDEEAVLKMVQRALKAEGYTVLPASNAAEALTVSRAHRGRVDLLLTDVVMPGLDGSALARILLPTRPGTKVLFMSAYPDGRLAEGEEGATPLNLLHKPFQISELRARVRRALDGVC